MNDKNDEERTITAWKKLLKRIEADEKKAKEKETKANKNN